jgi:ABC-type enterochelin transport system permease subunit
MLPERMDLTSLSVTLALSTGVATLSVVAGFSLWVAAIVGTATATVGCWTFVSRP